jgi:hypothetical protein
MKAYSLAHMSRHTPRRLSTSHTVRGQAVRRLMLDYIATCPHPPSLREIGEAVGLSSSSTVWSHVQTLREEGKLAPAKLGQPRAILLADPGPSEVELLRERVTFWRGACEQNSEARCTEERFAHIQEITTLRSRVEEAEELLRCERVLSARNGRRVDILLRQLVELEAECERLRLAIHD